MTQTSHSDAIFELTMTEVEARHVQTGIGLFLIQPHPYVDTSKYHREIAVGLYRQITEWIVERPSTKFFFYKIFTQIQKDAVADILNHGMQAETHETVIDRVREQLFGGGNEDDYLGAISY